MGSNSSLVGFIELLQRMIGADLGMLLMVVIWVICIRIAGKLLRHDNLRNWLLGRDMLVELILNGCGCVQIRCRGHQVHVKKIAGCGGCAIARWSIVVLV